MSKLQIRRLEAGDIEIARFAIAKASIECLAVANRQAFIHPLTISTWLLLSYAVVSLGGFWPTTQYGFLNLLRLVPVTAVSAVPIMFIIDWIHRPAFESLSRWVLRRPDLKDPLAYYKNHLASSFWILDYNGRPIGLIAVDSSTPADFEWLASEVKKRDCEDSLTIRHFYVDEEYRSCGVQEDLLVHAVRSAFKSDSTIQRIDASYSSLLPYIRDCLHSTGFVSDGKSQKFGLLSWESGITSLHRDAWSKD